MSVFQKPGFRDPLETLQGEQLRYPSVVDYLQSLHERYSGSRWVGYLGTLATIAEPVDTALGMDDDTPSGIAFYRGGLIGLHLLKTCASSAVRAGAQSITLVGASEAIDETRQRDEMARHLIDNCERGYASVPELHPLMDAWEIQIEPDFRYQAFVRRGLGIMLYAMDEAHEATFKVAAEKALEDGIDWDGAFAKLPKDI